MGDRKCYRRGSTSAHTSGNHVKPDQAAALVNDLTGQSRTVPTLPKAAGIPAKAGIQTAYPIPFGAHWIPAFAGMTQLVYAATNERPVYEFFAPA